MDLTSFPYIGSHCTTLNDSRTIFWSCVIVILWFVCCPNWFTWSHLINKLIGFHDIHFIVFNNMLCLQSILSILLSRTRRSDVDVQKTNRPSIQLVFDIVCLWWWYKCRINQFFHHEHQSPASAAALKNRLSSIVLYVYGLVIIVLATVATRLLINRNRPFHCKY